MISLYMVVSLEGTVIYIEMSEQMLIINIRCVKLYCIEFNLWVSCV